MAQPSWTPKRQKGESESSFKKRFYTAQRQDAEKRGRAGSDTAQAEVRKIYGKLGRKAPEAASGGGTDRVDNAALGLVTALAGGRTAKVGIDAAEGAAKGIGSALARRGGQQAAKKGTQLAERAVARAKPRVTAKVERPALKSAPKQLPKNSSAGASTAVERWENVRAPKVRRQNAIIRQSKAARGSRSDKPIPLTGSRSTPAKAAAVVAPVTTKKKASKKK